MSPSCRVPVCASLLVIAFALSAGVPASAQFIEEVRRPLDLSPDPLERSPRLLGMGRLSLVVDERNNRISMWDFAGNPVGIADDTVSTAELRPGSASSSSVHDLGDPLGRERQDFAARDLRLGFEIWRRRTTSAFGAIGDLGSVQVDRTKSQDFELRRNISHPNIMPIVAGRMPLLFPDRMRYALRFNAGIQKLTDRNRLIFRNDAGDYIDQNGQIGSADDFFTPDEVTATTLGGGVAVSYRQSEALTAAVGVDYNTNDVHGLNEGGRYVSERREDRPYGIGQASLIGRIGTLEYGADARGWKSSGEARWVFSISSGPGAIPVSDRGKLYDREEQGGVLRTRARWKRGSFEVGANFGVLGRKVTITEPRPDEMSFNRFRNDLYYRTGSDTLVVPDSILTNETQESGWDAGAGGAWQLPGRRGVVGVEVHRFRTLTEQQVGGSGPQRVNWDARAGLEYAVNPALAIRGGFIYGYEDRDEFTAQNEYNIGSVTLGMGVAPAGASWNIQWGYAFERRYADFGDPGLPREDRQRLALQILWTY